MKKSELKPAVELAPAPEVLKIETPVLAGLKTLGFVPVDANGKIVGLKPYATKAKAKELATKIAKAKATLKPIETAKPAPAKVVLKPLVDYKLQRTIETALDTLARVFGYIETAKHNEYGTRQYCDAASNAEVALNQMPFLLAKHPDNVELKQVIETAKDAFAFFANADFQFKLKKGDNLPFAGLAKILGKK